MEEKYTILSLSSFNTGIEFPIWRWKNRIPSKLYQYYLLKKLPIRKEEVFYMKEPGYRVFLPFTVEERKDNQTIIKKFVEKLMDKNEFYFIFAEKGLREYIDLPYIGSNWLLNYLFFPEILEKIVMKYQIDCKNMKLVILDSSDNRMEYILELLLPHLNHLTIVTNRPNYFDNLVDYALECTGLAVEILAKPLSEALPGNLIISLGNESQEDNLLYNKEYVFFEQNAVVLLLDGDPTKLEHMYYRRKDLAIIYDANITVHGEQIDKELVAEILCKLNWRLKLFSEHNGNLHYMHEVKELKKHYDMELGELCIL